MRVNAIRIDKNYGKEGYRCVVAIDAEFQKVELMLDEVRTQQVIDVVADLIVEAGKELAANLTKQALDHKALEHQVAV
jgi:hypothetical protein